MIYIEARPDVLSGVKGSLDDIYYVERLHIVDHLEPRF